MALPIFKIISNFFPGLDEKLIQAGIFEKPQHFVRKSTLLAFYISSFIIIMLTYTSSN